MSTAVQSAASRQTQADCVFPPDRIHGKKTAVIARRGGCSASFDELNKYFTISNMPVASSQYWNSVHGREIGEAEKDAEGLQTMRVLARNMSFLMKSIALGKEQFGLPEKEPWQPTHFIRSDMA